MGLFFLILILGVQNLVMRYLLAHDSYKRLWHTVRHTQLSGDGLDAGVAEVR